MCECLWMTLDQWCDPTNSKLKKAAWWEFFTHWFKCESLGKLHWHAALICSKYGQCHVQGFHACRDNGCKPARFVLLFSFSAGLTLPQDKHQNSTVYFSLGVSSHSPHQPALLPPVCLPFWVVHFPELVSCHFRQTLRFQVCDFRFGRVPLGIFHFLATGICFYQPQTIARDWLGM